MSAVRAWLWLLPLLFAATPLALYAQPEPPTNVLAVDRSWDGGTAVDISFDDSPDAPLASAITGPNFLYYSIRQCGEVNGVFAEVARLTPPPSKVIAAHKITITDLVRGEPYWFRVVTVVPSGSESPAGMPADQPVIPTRQFFDGTRFWLLIISGIICGSVVLFIGLARAGVRLYIRKIAGLEAVEEAVGRATEMGRTCLFVPGVMDINDIQTIAGLTILGRVAERAAEYDAKLEVPTSRSLVMTAARETVQAAYLTAGRPDAYNEDTISYVTDEQFGYVAYLTGQMVREKPAACFYLGSFFAESLILAETGNSIGAIQVAGTAQPAQLPFFVAACDYTLIGEEFFAASAYLSHDPDQLGSLKGQDVGKLIVAALMLVGVGLASLAQVTDIAWVETAADYVRNVMLASG